MLEPITLFDGEGHADLPENLNIVEFKQYLDDVWQSRPVFESEYYDNGSTPSIKQRFFKFDGRKIRARNYTGFVQYGSLRINVYPKVFSNQGAAFNPSHALHHLVKWLSYSSRIHFPFSELQTGIDDCKDWLEAFIFLFANYTIDVLNSSPHFAYEEITEEMSFLRGRIALPEYIKQNLITGRHHLLHCTYEPFVYDNLFNRIVKHTCRLLLTCTEEIRSKELLNDVLFLLDEVSDIHCTASDCDKVKINRLFSQNDSINNMCRLFLQFQQTNPSEQHNNNLCLLLPMEVIFEQYVAGFMKMHLDKTTSIQDRQQFLALNENGTNVFQMRHDILIPDKLIIDTKYKMRQLVDKDNKQGVSQTDLYQMVSYCYKRNLSSGLLLYPLHSGASVSNSTIFKVNEMKISIKSLDITEEDITVFDERQIEKFQAILKGMLA